MIRILLILVAICIALPSYSQSFDIEAYKEYLKTHQDMTAEELLQEYPAGDFNRYAKTDFQAAEYGDSIDQKYGLTPYEKQLIGDHGFMVTERLATNSYQTAFYDIYYKDLPVYISADAILHAVHYSFDKILEEIERRVLFDRLETALWKIHNYLPNFVVENSDTLYATALRDCDLYLSVAKKLIGSNAELLFSENQKSFDQILNYIELEQYAEIKLFTYKEPRDYDFSQFTPRGHYTKSPELIKYFRAMMWLGRTEIFITSPESYRNYTEKDIQRQNILAALITESAVKSGAIDNLNFINEFLKQIIGRQDNINLWEIDTAMQELNIGHPVELIDTNLSNEFREKLLKLNSANQLYNSQILYSEPDSLVQVKPASAFLLLGQRPILDGFITSKVVYDNIIYKNEKIKRLLPKTQDILFALGNDASAQLLENELNKYPYAANLASVRYLIESYDDEYWESTGYTNWLNAIRTLNPPKDRSNLPKFMQTAAWWQKTMTTQLASWAELRHDFLLYAKQPYTSGVIGCSFPNSFVEPVPEFYEAIANLGKKLRDAFDNFYLYDRGYFSNLISTCNKLKGIAEKELANQELSGDEISFLKSLLRIDLFDPGCGPAYKEMNGWYMKLYYGLRCDDSDNNGSDCRKLKPDLLVADVHTAPTDEEGNPVGWVLHAGTGFINMAVVVLDDPDEGCTRAYIGPVSSYYEYLSNNFKRLTDEEWKSLYTNAEQPLFANLYMADNEGQNKGEYEILHSVISSVDAPVFKSDIKSAIYPNPFSNSTIIAFSIPPSKGTKYVELNIYDINGNNITTLLNERLPPGNYSSRWDCKNAAGIDVSPGFYIYKLRVGDKVISGKMSYIK